VNKIDQTYIVGALADDLKTPLMQIAYTAELARHTKNLDSFGQIELLARSAMNDIDCLLLGLRSGLNQLELPLVAQSPSAAVYDAINLSHSFIKRYGCQVSTDFRVKNNAMLNPEALTAVLRTLLRTIATIGYGFSKVQKIMIYVGQKNNCPNIKIISSADIKQALRQISVDGLKHKNSADLSHIAGGGPTASIYVANQLLCAMNGKLKLISSTAGSGYSMTLMPSAQLKIV
jgi:hypothetical protein